MKSSWTYLPSDDVLDASVYEMDLARQFAYSWCECVAQRRAAHLVRRAVGEGAELLCEVEVHGIAVQARARTERRKERGHFYVFPVFIPIAAK